MRHEPLPPPAGWKMRVIEVVPGLSIGTRPSAETEYATLGVDAIVDLEDWEFAWVPPVPTGCIYLSFPIEDEESWTRRSARWRVSSRRWSAPGGTFSCTALKA